MFDDLVLSRIHTSGDNHTNLIRVMLRWSIYQSVNVNLGDKYILKRKSFATLTKMLFPSF